MRLDESSFGHTLEALQELFHSLRTPLGVALTIAKDSQRELPLSISDHEDAVSALEKIRGNLDELAPILGLTKLDCASLSLNEIALVCELEGFALDYQPLAQFNAKIKVSLLRIWLRCFYTSFSEQRRVGLEVSDRELIFSLIFESKLDAGPSKTFISFFAAACAAFSAKFEMLDGESKLRWSF